MTGNGWNPTYKNGDLGMVYLLHRLTHIKSKAMERLEKM